VHRLCDEEEIETMVLAVATLVARNANEAMVAPTVESGGVFLWQESDFSRREDLFTFFLTIERNFINFLLLMRFAKMMLQ
jgi:hypothetical protein